MSQLHIQTVTDAILERGYTQYPYRLNKLSTCAGKDELSTRIGKGQQQTEQGEIIYKEGFTTNESEVFHRNFAMARAPG